ncbi:MAG: aldose 1-epimerase family protein [Acidimicrobiales bacterium]
MDVQPSGQQFEIRWENQRAVVVEVGGGIRLYDAGERPVLEPYPADVMCDGAHGAPLIPWPNRLADGRYSFDGAEYQVSLSEPGKHNAIHGFLRWRPWRATSHGDAHVTMATRLFPLQGFPFLIDVEVEYSLGEEGLRVTTTGTNAGSRPCPYGAGQHPYLSPGSARIDDCTVQLAAGTRILTDDERQLPIGTEPVTGTAYDFSTPRLLGDQKIDFAFTDLSRDPEGRAWARLGGPDGRVAELWVDESYPIVELYTGDTLAPDRRRRGLGAEPMTCPPNAFQSGEKVIRLDPGQTVRTRWGARLR